MLLHCCKGPARPRQKAIAKIQALPHLPQADKQTAIDKINATKDKSDGTKRKNQYPEIFAKAWNFYLKKNTKDVWRLRRYADTFGISDKVEDILEVVSNQ